MLPGAPFGGLGGDLLRRQADRRDTRHPQQVGVVDILGGQAEVHRPQHHVHAVAKGVREQRRAQFEVHAIDPQARPAAGLDQQAMHGMAEALHLIEDMELGFDHGGGGLGLAKTCFTSRSLSSVWVISLIGFTLKLSRPSVLCRIVSDQKVRAA
ncbi:hypothetical protein D9M70_591530 [compost metagenome]